MKVRWIGSIFILMATLHSSLSFATEPPQGDQAKQTMALVDKAAALMATKGKAAFSDFRTKGSEWYQGDTYIYVYDMNGTLLMNPAFPMFEGANLINLTDIHMKAFVQQLVDVAKTKGSGWFDLMLPRPGQQVPTQKFGYVKTVKIPEGDTLIVGSGFWAK
jgi:signal transduction histidine kinase